MLKHEIPGVRFVLTSALHKAHRSPPPTSNLEMGLEGVVLCTAKYLRSLEIAQSSIGSYDDGEHGVDCPLQFNLVLARRPAVVAGRKAERCAGR